MATKIPERFKKYDDALGRRAFTTVFLLRFVFWMPPLLHAFFGVSKVRFWTHFWSSLAGYLVPLFLVSYFGQALFDWFMRAPIGVWIGLGLFMLLMVISAWRRGKRMSNASP